MTGRITDAAPLVCEIECGRGENWIGGKPADYTPSQEVSSQGASVVTVSFDIPVEVKQAFEAEFAEEERSLVMANLMREAVEERHRQRTRKALSRALTEKRVYWPSATDEALGRSRRAGRP